MIKPSNDRVLIKPIDLEHTTAGGIVLAGAEKDDRFHGKVLAIGPGKQNASGALIPVSQCQVGDTVIYGNVQNTIKDRLDDGAKCVLVVAEAIVGVIHD